MATALKKRTLALAAVCALTALASTQPLGHAPAAMDAALKYFLPVCGEVPEGVFCVTPPPLPSWLPPEVVLWLRAQ